VAAHRARQAHPAAGQLGGDKGIARHGHWRLTPGITDRQPEYAELFHLLDETIWVAAGVF
jgi:hypothetical protein